MGVRYSGRSAGRIHSSLLLRTVHVTSWRTDAHGQEETATRSRHPRRARHEPQHDVEQHEYFNFFFLFFFFFFLLSRNCDAIDNKTVVYLREKAKRSPLQDSTPARITRATPARNLCCRSTVPRLCTCNSSSSSSSSSSNSSSSNTTSTNKLPDIFNRAQRTASIRRCHTRTCIHSSR